MRLFDLNIETVLDHWEVHHGIREVIANALDEQTLSGTAPIRIARDGAGCWHVRDFGRGIKIEDFTLNENPEKIGTDGVIGKFGVGLKDALATFDRHGVGVSISSPHGRFTLTKATKHDFDAITTLHIAHDPGDPLTEGTDVFLTGVTDAAVETAKSMFLCFREHRILDRTAFGQVIAKPREGDADVFINGVWVNAEPSFLFSYNVTSLTETMRKALNRERVNVGRIVYADRLRQILKASQAAEVSHALATAYSRKDMGDLPEELTWIDVANKALNELARLQKVVVVSQEEIKTRPELVEDIKRDGHQIVLVTDREKQKADDQARTGGAPFHTLATWIRSVSDSFKYTFVEEGSMNPAEIAVFRRHGEIMRLVGVPSSDAPKVMVSETLQTTTDATEGAWDAQIPAIVIKRTQLASLRSFAGTLLHELAHSKTGTVDCTRAFENALTRYLGAITESCLGPQLWNNREGTLFPMGTIGQKRK